MYTSPCLLLSLKSWKSWRSQEQLVSFVTLLPKETSTTTPKRLFVSNCVMMMKTYWNYLLPCPRGVFMRAFWRATLELVKFLMRKDVSLQIKSFHVFAVDANHNGGLVMSRYAQNGAERDDCTMIEGENREIASWIFWTPKILRQISSMWSSKTNGGYLFPNITGKTSSTLLKSQHRARESESQKKNSNQRKCVQIDREMKTQQQLNNQTNPSSKTLGMPRLHTRWHPHMLTVHQIGRYRWV